MQLQLQLPTTLVSPTAVPTAAPTLTYITSGSQSPALAPLRPLLTRPRLVARPRPETLHTQPQPAVPAGNLLLGHSALLSESLRESMTLPPLPCVPNRVEQWPPLKQEQSLGWPAPPFGCEQPLSLDGLDSPCLPLSLLANPLGPLCRHVLKLDRTLFLQHGSLSLCYKRQNCCLSFFSFFFLFLCVAHIFSAQAIVNALCHHHGSSSETRRLPDKRPSLSLLTSDTR